MGKRVELRDVAECDMEAARNIYEGAFPPEERIPFDRLMGVADGDRVRMIGIYEGQELVGIMYSLRTAEMAVLAYLAVAEHLRDCGYGSGAIRRYTEGLGCRAVTMMETLGDPNAPNMAIRKRRETFYNRFDYVDTGYRLRTPGGVFDILGTDGFDMDQFRDATAPIADGNPSEIFKR